MGLPDHDPLEVVSVSPWTAVPVICGALVLLGGAGEIDPVELEVAEAEPPELLAVTVTSIAEPTSELCSVYVLLVAPLMLVHWLLPLQSRHW